jgi:hypothetical protein
MAGKGRRTASRQAELNRKRKRGTKGPSGIPSTSQSVDDLEVQGAVPVSTGVADVEINDPETLEGAKRPVDLVSVASRAPRPSPVARTPVGEFAAQSMLRGERPAAYLYVGAELRRIIVLTGAIIAALIVLGILL